MGMYCLMTCDRRIEGAWPDDVLTPICFDSWRESIGRTPRETRAQARREGWIRKDGRDICPGCQKADREGTVPFIG